MPTSPSKWQIQYQSPDHPKGSNYWQTTRTFKARDRAEAEAAKIGPWATAVRVIEKRA